MAVAATVLYQQRQMRDSALALYDRAFVANNDMNNARVLFQRFADQRESASDMRAISRVNRAARSGGRRTRVAADRADEPSLRGERLEARSAVLAFEANFGERRSGGLVAA